jgi:hypothetical protein
VFSDLITLAVGQPLRPLETTATCIAQPSQGAPQPFLFEVTYNREPVAPVLPQVASRDMLFTLPMIHPRFQNLVCAWYAHQENIKPLYLLYFSTTRSPGMYVDHRFLNMFQALESYHRRTSIPAAEKVGEHKLRVDRILGKVDPKDRKWLKNRIERIGELSAADKIRELAKRFGADWIISEADIELAGHLRNFITHFDPEVEKRLPPKKDRTRIAYNLSVRLKALCELILLQTIGFSAPDVRDLIIRTRRLEGHLAK